MRRPPHEGQESRPAQEGDQLLLVALRAAPSRETAGQDAAGQRALEFGAAGDDVLVPEEHVTLDADPDRERVVVYPNRIKLGLLVLGALVFVVLGVGVALVADDRGIALWKVVLVAYIGVPFFAFCGFISARRLVVRRPALVIDSHGITDAASAVGVGRLGWDEVGRVVLYRVSGQPMLGIFPRDPASLLARLPLHLRLVARLNLAVGWAPINIPQAGLDTPLIDLARRIEALSRRSRSPSRPS